MLITKANDLHEKVHPGELEKKLKYLHFLLGIPEFGLLIKKKLK